MSRKASPAITAALIVLTAVSSLRAQVPHPVAKRQFDAGWDVGVVGGHSLRPSVRPGGCVDIPHPVVDTTHSFTVTACVKPKRATGWQTFADIDGS